MIESRIVLDHAKVGGQKSALYMFGPSDDDARFSKIVVRVGRRKKMSDPDGRLRVQANWVVTVGLVEKFNLKDSGMELIAGSLVD